MSKENATNYKHHTSRGTMKHLQQELKELDKKMDFIIETATGPTGLSIDSKSLQDIRKQLKKPNLDEMNDVLTKLYDKVIDLKNNNLSKFLDIEKMNLIRQEEDALKEAQEKLVAAEATEEAEAALKSAQLQVKEKANALETAKKALETAKKELKISSDRSVAQEKLESAKGTLNVARKELKEKRERLKQAQKAAAAVAAEDAEAAAEQLNKAEAAAKAAAEAATAAAEDAEAAEEQLNKAEAAAKAAAAEEEAKAEEDDDELAEKEKHAKEELEKAEAAAEAKAAAEAALEEARAAVAYEEELQEYNEAGLSPTQLNERMQPLKKAEEEKEAAAKAEEEEEEEAAAAAEEAAAAVKEYKDSKKTKLFIAKGKVTEANKELEKARAAAKEANEKLEEANEELEVANKELEKARAAAKEAKVVKVAEEEVKKAQSNLLEGIIKLITYDDGEINEIVSKPELNADLLNEKLLADIGDPDQILNFKKHLDDISKIIKNLKGIISQNSQNIKKIKQRFTKQNDKEETKQKNLASKELIKNNSNTIQDASASTSNIQFNRQEKNILKDICAHTIAYLGLKQKDSSYTIANNIFNFIEKSNNTSNDTSKDTSKDIKGFLDDFRKVIQNAVNLLYFRMKNTDLNESFKDMPQFKENLSKFKKDLSKSKRFSAGLSRISNEKLTKFVNVLYCFQPKQSRVLQLKSVRTPDSVDIAELEESTITK